EGASTRLKNERGRASEVKRGERLGDVAPVHDPGTIREEEIVDNACPQRVGETELSGRLFTQDEDVPEAFRGENSLPDGQEVADALAEALDHALGVHGRHTLPRA